MAFPNSHWFILSPRLCSPEPGALGTFVCLSTSPTRMCVEIRPWPSYRSLGSSVAFPAHTVRSSPLSALDFLRYAIRLPKSPSPFHEISHNINSHQPPRHLRGSNCRGTICLPELNPVNSQTPNYAPVAVGLVLTYTLGFWAISARRWFAESIKRIAGEEKLN
jgi:hypothetical protein